MFDIVLIANRGVIACRVAEACIQLGIPFVSVYTPEDKGSRHISLAERGATIPGYEDEKRTFCISDYEDGSEYTSICGYLKRNGRNLNIAIHPGYGFLAEDEFFAETIMYHDGIYLVGPSHQVIRKLGNKIEARKGAREAGVPITEGTGAIDSEKQALEAAEALGYPIMIKATAGGGGRGIEKVEKEGDLIAAYRRVREQAAEAFHDNSVYFEKALQNFRHIEVQILGDARRVVHLYERDCSIQRRNQKLIEYSPADISGRLRTKITRAAVRAARAFGYTNAGTVEFLVDENNNFYFMEVNTRIQVEHRVTELLTGIDLIEQQFRIASGERLPFYQKGIKPRGFSLECRIYAEDPERDFRGTPGRITRIHIPKAEDLIIDTHLQPGFEIGTSYDALIANVIVLGKDKKQAVGRMEQALTELVIEGDGIKTTIPYHLDKIREI